MEFYASKMVDVAFCFSCLGFHVLKHFLLHGSYGFQLLISMD